MNGFKIPSFPFGKSLSEKENQNAAYPGNANQNSNSGNIQNGSSQYYPSMNYNSYPPPQTQQQNQLPPGWISQWDPTSQRPYFVDTATGLSQWNDPRVPLVAPPQPVQYQQHQHSQQTQPHEVLVSMGGQAQAPPTVPFTSTAGQQVFSDPQKPAFLPVSQGPTGPVSMGGQAQALPTVPFTSTASQQVFADPQKPAFLPVSQVSSHGTELAYNSHAPSVGLVETVDPTVAVALELKQSIPTLRTGPPPNAKQAVKDAYRTYLREIQDYQNQHTRTLRDAQVRHQKAVQDADYYSKHDMQNQLSNGISSFGIGGRSLLSAATSLFNKGAQFTQQRDKYNKKLRDAKTNYEQTVEHSSQRLNDSVEQANRRYDDVIYELYKADQS